MKLISMRIENFRSFRDETIYFDDYNALVGANGAGKSSVLTALNVFFRNNSSTATNVQSLAKEDFHHQDISKPIRITLTFESLSEQAQIDFSHYFRQGRLVVFAKGEWDEKTQTAEVGQYGARLVMEAFAPFFAAIDEKAKVSELKDVYTSIRAALPDLPQPGTKQAMIDALREYEENHLEDCELIDDTAQFYGWSKGANLLRKYIQWVYVPAVKDASTEQDEGSRTALGQLLERTIRSKVNFQEPIAELKSELEKQYQKLLDGEQEALSEMQQSLQDRMRAWATPDANVLLKWHFDPSKSLVVNEPVARVSIGEGSFIGEVARLGHGMQRAFIVSMLQELAEIDQESSPRLLLGFEEPELYQHPPQAQHIASVLEKLSADKKGNTQVIVSTHSPFFVSTKGFEQVRAVRKRRSDESSFVMRTTFQDLEEVLANAMDEKPASPSALMARVEQIMQPSQKELFFCGVAVLVEGIEDVAFLSTWLQLSGAWNDFRKYGCHFIVAGGKSPLSRPLAIANQLGIPAFVIFDSDAHDKKAKDANKRDNSCILRLCGLTKFDPLPSDTFWHDRGVMWNSTITRVIPDDFGQSDWDGAEKEAKDQSGFAEGVRRKNNMLIAATLEKLHSKGKGSETLTALCDRIIDFARNSTT